MSLPLDWAFSKVRSLLSGELSSKGSPPDPQPLSLAPFETAGLTDLAVLPLRASPYQRCDALAVSMVVLPFHLEGTGIPDRGGSLSLRIG